MIDCPSIININRLIDIYCYRLPSIIDFIDCSGPELSRSFAVLHGSIWTWFQNVALPPTAPDSSRWEYFILKSSLPLIAGLNITARQRTMSGLMADLTGQTLLLPVILTGHFWIQTFYFPYGCHSMPYNVVMISFSLAFFAALR